MKVTRCADILRFSVIILFSLIRSSHQTVYSCNASVSCGCSANSVSITRIVGGENAGTATWDWAVSISIDGNYLCGGSIISSSWVITAAHCVVGYTASQITIYAGSNRRFSGTQTRVASKVIVHSSYNADTHVNDIALLQLSTPLKMSDPYVSTICIPSVSSAILSAGEWPPVNTTVVAVGWGKLSDGGSLPSTLQQVTLQTVSYQASTCRPVMADWHLQLCAGVSGGGKDTCQGDSGGPLMMFTSSRQWVLIGLTSSGIGCARATDSGLYTRVAAYQSWIYSNTNGSVSTLTSTAFTTPTSSTRTMISTSRSSASSTSSRSTQTTVSTSRSSTPSTSSRSTQTTVPTSRSSAPSTSSRSTQTTVSTSRSSASSASSRSTQTMVSTTSVAVIHLHANTVGTSIFTVFALVLFNLLVAFYY